MKKINLSQFISESQDFIKNIDKYYFNIDNNQDLYYLFNKFLKSDDLYIKYMNIFDNIVNLFDNNNYNLNNLIKSVYYIRFYNNRFLFNIRQYLINKNQEYRINPNYRNNDDNINYYYNEIYIFNIYLNNFLNNIYK